MARIWPYIRIRFRSLFRQERVSLEIHEELRSHVEQEAQDLMQSGWPRREARVEAERRFGNSERVYQNCSEQYMMRGGIATGFLRDAKGALQVFRSKPGFALATVLMAGLGIGATTTIFSVVDHVLLRPLPYPEEDRLVTVGKGRSGMPVPDFLDVRDRTGFAESFGAVWTREQDMTGIGTPERVNVGQLTRDLLSILGASATAGRLFLDNDFSPNPSRVAVLSHGLWQRRFGGQLGAVGGSITLEGQPYDVVGVLAEDFVDPEALVRGSVDVWTPLDTSLPFLQERNAFVLRTVARLSEESSIAAAQSELNNLSEILAEEHPDGNRRANGTTIPFPLRSLHDATVRDIGNILSVVLGAVGLMLLIACANIANLFLARGIERSREMALRTALGAARARLLRQLLTESTILGIVGGLLGLVLALFGVRAFAAFNAGGIPRVASVSVDWRIVCFAVGLSVFTGVLFGLLPALRSVNSNLATELKDFSAATTGTRNRNLTRDVLVVVEVALAMVLLVGAGLLFNSFLNLRRVDPGLNTENVLIAELRFGLPFGWGSTRYADEESKTQFTNTVLEAVRGIPGVVSAGGSLSSPFSAGCCWSNNIVRNDRMADSVESWMRPVTTGYLETIGARLISGRLFTESDDQRRVVDADEDSEDEVTLEIPAIVSSSLARRLWPNESALGGELVSGRLRAQVVGVIDDVSNITLDEMGQYDLYLPYRRIGAVFDRLDISVRHIGSTESTAGALRETIWNIDPDLPVGTLITMNQRMANSMQEPRFYSLLFTVFALVSVLLAASGIHASMAYVVWQRRRELGIRIALGGRPVTVLRRVLGHAALLTCSGVAIGLGGALALSRLLESFLFGITTTDSTTFVLVSTLLGVAAMVACLLPAARAAGTDPLEVLRME